MKTKNQYKEFPKPVAFRKLIGPSFIILALGLGSGEVILWPYLAVNYGLGIAWGAVLGITFQYFMNMEIERYALVKGESVFVGLNRLFKWSAYWFIVSTFIGFGLPGIIAASAKIFAELLGVQDFKYIAIAFLLLIGFILSAGKTVYGMMEKITKTVILMGVPFVLLLAVYISSKADWVALFRGVVGRGADYQFFPESMVLATFLAAFAYSGAGGNLNLTQSIYIKEKGYGMGKYAQKISGLFVKNGDKKIKLSGVNFEVNAQSVSRFKVWWKNISIEHLIVFWFIGSLTMLLLMVLAYATAYGVAGSGEGINFLLNEGVAIGQATWPIIGSLFLAVVSIMLFQTQLGVMDSTSRIMAENFAEKKLDKHPDGVINLSKIYYTFLWAQIGFGIILFLFNIYEPKTLLVLGAVINSFAMFAHIALVSFLNHKTLHKVFRPSWIRKIIMLSIFLFFGYFSVIVLLDKLGLSL